MKSVDILKQRLRIQRLEGGFFDKPAQAVSWFGAVQSQDYAGAAWAICQRTKGLTRAYFDAAFARGDILRTHVMRPTWHFVAQEDIGWLIKLTAPRILKTLAYYYRQLELDEKLLEKTNSAIKKALQGGKHLTKNELTEVLVQADIDTKNNLRTGHIFIHAELSGLICSGALAGKQHTFALLEERAPNGKKLSYEQALTELAKRYFTSHGPATLRDFTWWSGLTLAEAKAGLKTIETQLKNITVANQTFWFVPSAKLPALAEPCLHLLPNYDEYIVAYSDRTWLFDTKHNDKLDSRQNPLFNNVIISDGRIIGTWKRTGSGKSQNIETKVFESLSKAQLSKLDDLKNEFLKRHSKT